MVAWDVAAAIAAIVLTLRGLGVGPEAIPATIIFRLLNYWLMVPIALVSYHNSKQLFVAQQNGHS